MIAHDQARRGELAVERDLLAASALSALWKCVLRIEAEFLPGHCAGFFLFPVDVGRPTVFRLRHPTVNWTRPEEWRIPFERDHAVGYLKANPGCGPFRIREIFEKESDWEATEFFLRICIPYGWVYRIVVPFWHEGGFIGAASFHRSRDQGDHSNEDMRLLARLQPRLTAATVRVLRTEDTKLKLRSLKKAAALLADPRAVVDGEGKKLCATGAWRALMGIRKEGKALEILPQPLVEAVRELVTAERSTRRRVTADGRVHLITRAGPPRAEIAHLQMEADNRLSAGCLPVLDHCSKLTSAEIDVVQLARKGCTNRQLARRRRTSIHTVRKQLASACAKLGVTSRYALTRFESTAENEEK